MRIETSAGVLTLKKPTPEQLGPLGAYLPLTEPLSAKKYRGHYGILMQCGTEEIWAIKQQPVDVKESHGFEAAALNASLIVRAIPRYMMHGYTGLLMPCAYLRPKPKRMVEVGIVYFGGAHHADRKARRGRDPLVGIDPQVRHGAGFGKMVTAFMRCLAETSTETGTYLFTAIDMDLRPWSELGTVLLSCLIHGQDVYSLTLRTFRNDPTWTWLRSGGIRRVYALPTMPLEIPVARKRGGHVE